MHVVCGLDGHWHTQECLQARGISPVQWKEAAKDPTPCGSQLRLGLIWEWRGKREEIKTCPANLVDPGLIPILSLYNAWEKGFLWTEGGLAHQPAAYVQAMQFLAGEIQRVEEAKREGLKEGPRPPRPPKGRRR